jgi:hypothetical protein
MSDLTSTNPAAERGPSGAPTLGAEDDVVHSGVTLIALSMSP